MNLIIWSSSGLSTAAGAVELTRGQIILGLGLFVVAVLVGPVAAWVTR